MMPSLTSRQSQIWNGAYVELQFPGDFAKLILTQQPPPDTEAKLRVYMAPLKSAVVEHKDKSKDLLTPDDNDQGQH